MADGVAAFACRSCGAGVAPHMLACPSCLTLVHAETLSRLAAEASDHERTGDVSGALSRWREAVVLLPAGTVQQRQVHERIASLSALSDRGTPPANAGKRSFAAAVTAAVVFALTKLKLLLLGLTKASTFFSMILAFGVYWTAWGWTFAAGFVLSIYIHEMGHVAALSRYGIKASAPMFIPGFGAIVRLQQAFLDEREDARCGLAGPVWGLGAALACLGLFGATQAPVFAALTRTGAWINLFNLLPVWQLDGARGLRAIAKRDRWILAAIAGAMAVLTHEGMLGLIALAMVVVTWNGKAPERSDRVSFLQYAALLVTLSALSAIPVEMP